MHLGEKISEVIKLRHTTKQAVGRAIGFTGSAATYLTTRPSIDVETLQKIGNHLKYDFFKHFPVTEEETAAGQAAIEKTDERDKTIAELKNKIAELEKNLDSCMRNQAMQKQENAYLKKINELLEKKGV